MFKKLKAANAARAESLKAKRHYTVHLTPLLVLLHCLTEEDLGKVWWGMVQAPGLRPHNSLQKVVQMRWLRRLQVNLQETQVVSRGSQYCSSGQDPIATPGHRPCGAERWESQESWQWPGTHVASPSTFLDAFSDSAGRGSQTILASNPAALTGQSGVATSQSLSFPICESVVLRPLSH
jgi:hypothetical protein